MEFSSLLFDWLFQCSLQFHYSIHYELDLFGFDKIDQKREQYLFAFFLCVYFVFLLCIEQVWTLLLYDLNWQKKTNFVYTLHVKQDRFGLDNCTGWPKINMACVSHTNTILPLYVLILYQK